MVSSKELQTAYVKLYTQIREYIWPIYVVEEIAQLELDVYQAVANIPIIKADFYRLSRDIREQLREDDELKRSFDDFEKLLNDDNTYLKLYKTHEVVHL